MWKEFKEFAMKGNIVDLAIGVIIGGAFQKIVTSLVNDIIMPLISLITGKIDFTNLSFTVGEISVKYGNFITTIVDFIVIAFSIFLIVRYINKLNRKLEEVKEKEAKKHKKFFKKKEEEKPTPPPTTKICPYCYSEINIKATRCPHCTAELDESNVKE